MLEVAVAHCGNEVLLNSALTIAIPTFAVLLGIIFNRQDSIALRAEIVQLRKDMAIDMTQLRKDLNGDMAQLRKDLTGDMAQLRKDLNGDMAQLRDSIHRDMIGLHERVAVVEAKQTP